MRLVERVAKVSWVRDEEETKGVKDTDVARKILGMSISPDGGAASTISVVDVAGVREKPGVVTRSRRVEAEEGKEDGGGSEVVMEKGDEIRAKRRNAPPPPVNGRGIGNGNAPGAVTKKLPPKAPPRRRTRPKTATTESGGQVADTQK